MDQGRETDQSNEADQYETALVAGPAEDDKDDTFSNLPLDIVLQIVRYLDLFDMVRCQRVRHYQFRALEAQMELIISYRTPLRSRSGGVQFSYPK